MTRVQATLRVPGTMPLPALLTLIQDVEAAGFDGVGILDSQLLCRDTFVTLGLAAVNTSRLMLFPAVTNPFTRHVSVLASAVQTVDELAPGRTKVVIGTGYTSAHTIGRKPATLAEMRGCIATLRALLAGQAVDFGTTSGRLAYASERRIPVLMAASGPKAIELAGEVADGVMLSVGFHRGIVDAVLGHLAEGARRGGRKLEDLEIVWAVRAGIRHHRRGSPAGETQRRPSGHLEPEVALDRTGRPRAAALRDPAGRPEHLSRSVPRARLGAGHRRDVLCPGRGRRAAL